MRLRVLLAIAAVVVLSFTAAASAQYGHPLDGQWSGEWGPKDKPNRLLIDLDWDGKEITGTINPGPNAAEVKKATVDASNPAAWVVKIEAEGKDASGKAIQIRVDGKLENIGAYYRILRGTWIQNGQKGEFLVTRN